jgi:protoheme IX farnesyltransferase
MLTKPGIILGNAITTAAGFAMASKGSPNYWLFLATLIGLSLIIASAGVFNNYIDRAMDAKMARTKQRPLVTGKISSQKALLFATFLGVMGTFILGFYTNFLATAVALTGFFVYLVLYAFWKYRSFYGTLVGSIAGALPPVVGYCAVSNQLDMGALLLFLILVLWQMPHFFAIAIYQYDDYAAASIPVLPVVKGNYITKLHMLFYIIAFLIVTFMLTFTGYTGNLYLVIAASLGFIWLGLCINGFRVKNDKLWARKMFAVSIVVIMGLSLAISTDVV